MSDVTRSAREWRLYIKDMVQFGKDVLSYTDGLDYSAFITDRLTYDATLRKLQLIGQAATNIPSEVQDAHPSIPWNAIVETRNRLANSYLHINDEAIWSIIRNAVPALLPSLRDLLGTAPDQVG
ncbi:MAG: DUF86 domain-containing protein [Synechococcus sp. SB0676_bin_10]|uniref:DUF86 domain-containing protein n=1 Tax=Synechococcus sp. SB0676_bin_10 TaxID=2604869 RepID=A0A6B1F8R0_9SYNE|nr:DUF86 domain-containing protein [Cyanobacteria bacterium MAG IRC3_bin_20]MDE0647183.1 DUF86 domain-containing protein [Cyanobacteria bacterium MAG IRC4_bin_6]MYG38557.1 DUF86 domain-containing protein [Synechococcus sp. SB0676_bin_10]